MTAVADRAACLTPREDQVLGLIGLGLTNREIGGRLGIAEKTVKNTVTGVLAKLGLQRRGQAIIYVTVRRMAGDATTHSAAATASPAATPDGTADEIAAAGHQRRTPPPADPPVSPRAKSRRF